MDISFRRLSRQLVLSQATELVVLVSANAVATVVRFGILRQSIAGAAREATTWK